MKGSGENEMLYNKMLGQQLRKARLEKGFSLKDVEEKSEGSFKSSVLGAYERGDRHITVHRLYKLADFYKVPVSYLLIREKQNKDVNALSQTGKIRVNLERLEKMPSKKDKNNLTRYFELIKLQRGDINEKVITIRRDDLRSLACLLALSPSELTDKLERMKLTEVDLY